ncbi:MAG: hypothetical protein CMP20_02780 [Rickettsiales bacterium]|nr:hypothetical protein [Rickettsiales bacterium]
MLPPHRRFLSPGFYTEEELTNYVDAAKTMLCGSDVFNEFFADGVPNGPERVLKSIDFLNHGDPDGPARVVFWMSMLVYWPKMQQYVEKNWPGSLSSPYGQQFLANVENSIGLFCYGNLVDVELLQHMRNAMNIYVFEQQTQTQTIVVRQDPLSGKRKRQTDCESECVVQSKEMVKKQKLLNKTQGTVAKSKKRPVLLGEEFIRRIDTFRENMHLQFGIRGQVSREKILNAFSRYERLDFIVRIFLIIARLEGCQMIRLQGKTGAVGVALEAWVPIGQQFEQEEDEEIDIDDLDLLL